MWNLSVFKQHLSAGKFQRHVGFFTTKFHINTNLVSFSSPFIRREILTSRVTQVQRKLRKLWLPQPEAETTPAISCNTRNICGRARHNKRYERIAIIERWCESRAGAESIRWGGWQSAKWILAPLARLTSRAIFQRRRGKTSSWRIKSAPKAAINWENQIVCRACVGPHNWMV